MSADGRQIKNVARDVGALTLNSCGDLWAAVWEQAQLVSSSTIYCIPDSNWLSELHTGRVCCCIQYGMCPPDFSCYRAFAKIQHWFFNSSSKGLVITAGSDWSWWTNTEANFAQRLPGRPDVPVRFMHTFKWFGCGSAPLCHLVCAFGSSLPYSTAGADLLCQGPTLVPNYALTTSSNAGMIQPYRSEPDRHS